MQNTRLLMWSFAAVLLAVLAMLFLARRESGPPANSITARYMGESGERPSEARTAIFTLWVTNKTQMWLNIHLTGIEVLLGNAWTNYHSDGGGMLNSPRFPFGKGIYSTTLPPRTAAYGRCRGLVCLKQARGGLSSVFRKSYVVTATPWRELRRFFLR